MKTLKIEIPQGYEIDKEKSTFENIVFKLAKKELPKSWEELEEINGYFINKDSNVLFVSGCNASEKNKDLFSTKEQAEASIALAQLSQLLVVYNDGKKESMYSIRVYKDGNPDVFSNLGMQSFLSFKDLETAELFLTNFKDLILTAKPLL